MIRSDWVRRCVELEPGAGNPPERTHRDGFEGRVPTTREGVERMRHEALRALEWRRFRCDEIPVRES